MSGRRISAAVLAGGASRRMGTDKALVDAGGLPLVSHVIDRVKDLSEDVFVVAKRPLAIDARVVIEPAEPQTPLLGVLTALRSARHDLVFVCGCDMPFASPALAIHLAERMSAGDAVVPARDGEIEPLHGVWSPSAAGAISRLLDGGERGLRAALGKLEVDVVEVDPGEVAFTNVNTPEDLEDLRGRSGPRPPSSPRSGT